MRRKPRTFNTAFESGIRSLIILTSCYPISVGLHKLVVLDHLVVHSGDVDGPPSLHPPEDSRAAEMLVRRGLVSTGLDLMGTRNLVKRHATSDGFRYEAGEEAGSFVDLLQSQYTVELKIRANWLNERIVPMSDIGMVQLVRDRMDRWATEFLAHTGVGN
jgi:hypothetical protein